MNDPQNFQIPIKGSPIVVLRPGDTLIISASAGTPKSMLDLMNKTLHEQLPKGVKHLVIAGCDIAVGKGTEPDDTQPETDN